MKRGKKNDGTVLQDKMQEALKTFQENKASFFYRFADTRTAATWLPVQPGDFLWLLPGVPAILIETKSTDTGATLKSLLDPAQCGKHRLWQRAGHLSAFVYADLASQRVEWHDGRKVVRENDTKNPICTGYLGDITKLLLKFEEVYRD